jgi:ribosomal subunit interface protein
MHLYVTARHFELTDSIRGYVHRRLVHAVEAHSSPHDTSRMEIQLYQIGDGNLRFGCHVLLQMPAEPDINIREESVDLYAAIDGAEKRLIRQLVSHRERRLSGQRHPRKFSWDRLGRALGWGR